MHRLLILCLLGFSLLAITAGEKKGERDLTELEDSETDLTGAFRESREIRRIRKKKPLRHSGNNHENKKPKKKHGKEINLKIKRKNTKNNVNKVEKIIKHETSNRRKLVRQSSTADKECLDRIVKAKKLNNKGANYMRQASRITKQNKTGSNKHGMKDDFATLSIRLVDVGGGNKSELSCSGETGNDGATKLKEAVETLDMCDDNIAEACNVSSYSLPEDFDTVGDCVTNFKSLAAAIKVCDELDLESSEPSDYCACFNGGSATAANETYDGIITKAGECKVISKENAATTKEHAKCKKAFKACNTVKKDSPSLLYSCAQTKAELEAKAAQTKTNVDELTKAKDKTKALAGSRHRAHSRKIRATLAPLATCAEVTATNILLLDAAENTPFNEIVETYALLVSAVSSSITCSADEMATLTTQVTSLEEAVATVQKVYEDFTDSVANSGTATTVATTAAAAVTQAMALRRDRLVRDILAKMTV